MYVQTVRLRCLYVQNHFYHKIYCKDSEKEKGIMEWIISVHQKCMCTMVITQRLRKRRKVFKNWPIFRSFFVVFEM